VDIPSNAPNSAFTASFSPTGFNSGIVFINLCIRDLTSSSQGAWQLAQSTSVVVVAPVQNTTFSCRRNVITAGSTVHCFLFGIYAKLNGNHFHYGHL
jgi:hypothetical protein